MVVAATSVAFLAAGWGMVIATLGAFGTGQEVILVYEGH